MAKQRVYFSFRSPYSWLAVRALEKQGLGLTQRGSEIEYLPFFEPQGECLYRLKALGGECLYQPMSREKHLYIMQDARRLIEDQDLKPVLPRDPLAPDWSIPHLVYLALQHLELGTEFALDAMEARWLNGTDIWQWKEMETLLTRRLNNQEANAVLEAAQGELVLDKAAHALRTAHKDGVFGVPFMRAGRHKFWGQDRVDNFIAQLLPLSQKEKSTS